MLSYIYYILGYDYKDSDLDNNEDIYIDKELIKVKNNLKKVKSLKKQFYTPTITELNNQIDKIKNKNKIFLRNIAKLIADLIKNNMVKIYELSVSRNS